MAKYIICEKCKKLIEYNPEIKHEVGTSFYTLICPFCGHKKESNVSHVHYGQDGKK